MKKISLFILGAMLALTLTACSGSGNESAAGTSGAANGAAAQTAPDGVAVQQTEDGLADKMKPVEDAEPAQIITVYHSNDDATGAVQTLDGLDGDAITAEGLVDKLIEYGVLDEGTEVDDFTISDKVGTLDLSQVPSSLGTSGELIMLTCIGNTFVENFELDSLKLLVNGDNYSSGHIEQGDDDYLTYNSKYKTLGE